MIKQSNNMKELQKQYFDCLDRLYLNGLNINCPTSKKQVEKDEELLGKLKEKLGLK